MLFILYVNDLIIHLNDIFVIKYADDTSFVIKNKNIDILTDTTNMLLNEINIWFSNNKLKLNTSKTSLIGFQLTNNGKYNNVVITCNNDNVLFSDHSKLLGVTIDNHLKWACHVDQLCKKLSTQVFALRILSKNVNEFALKSVYFAHVHSLIMYGLEFWGQAADHVTDRVFKLQKKAIRILAGVPPRTSCRDLFKKFEILPMPALYIAQVLIFFKKQPHYMADWNKFDHNYNTRNKDKIVLTQHKTSAYEKGLMYAGQYYYNKLPKRLRSENNVNVFKQKIKMYLLSNNIYKLSEFR